MKLKLFTFLLLLIHTINFAQQNLQSTASIDNFKNTHTNISELRKSILNSDGTSYLFGTQDATYSTMDVYVIKLNQSLDTLWTHIISTPDGKSIDEFKNAEVDSNGNIYVHSANFIYADFYQTDSKHFVTKLNSNGTLIYRKSLEDVANENNEPNNYVTTNYSHLFSHLDDNNEFVFVYTAHSPTSKITFFKFAPNNTTSIIHRTDLLAYNPATDPFGYFVNFFYSQGNYYYTSGVKQASQGNPHINRLNKMLSQGFLTLDITPYVGTNQILLNPDIKDLKNDHQGNTLYFNFDKYNFTSSFFSIITNDSLQILGSYNDSVKLNKFDSSYILPNGNLRIFSRSTPMSNTFLPKKLTETVISTNGNVLLDTVYQNFSAVDLLNINSTSNAVIKTNSVEIVDNDWNIIKQYNGINLNRINRIKKYGTDYFVYINKLGFVSDLFQNEFDYITTCTFKLTDNVTIYPNFSYQGNGSANCWYEGVSTLLNDGSRVLFYNCSKGSSITSMGTLNEHKTFVKRVDNNLNPIWDNNLDLSLGSNIIKDNNDAIYFWTQTPNYWIIAPYPIYYYLNKMNADGTFAYKLQSSQFNNIFIKDDFLYSTFIENNEMIVNKYNKNTGSLIQTFSIPQNRLINQYIDSNDNVYFYFGKENSTQYGYNNSIVIYKNFIQIAEVFMGNDFGIPIMSKVDPFTKSIFFGSHQNLTSVYKIFKVNTDGTKQTITTPTQYNPIEEINNSVYFKDDNKLYQINKNTLNIDNEIPIMFQSRFIKKDDNLIHLVHGNILLNVYNENLQNIGSFNLEDNDFSYLYFTDDNKIHQFQEVSKRYLTQALPRWMISRMKLYDYNEVTLSTENDFEQINNTIKVFPNPSSDIVNINVENDTIITVEVYSVNGKYIRTHVELPLNISYLDVGTYFLKITTKNKKVYFSKIIKK